MTSQSSCMSGGDPLLSAGALPALCVPPPSPPWEEHDAVLMELTLETISGQEILQMSTPFLPEALDNVWKEDEEIAAVVAPSDVTKADTVGYCEVCKLVFSSPGALALHRTSFEQRNVCCHCNKSFATRCKLRIHHRKHSKEKPFHCQLCGRYYTHKTTLSRHQLMYCPAVRAKCDGDQKTKDSEEEESMPVSPAASDSSATTSSATRCRVCDKEFFDSASLRNHNEYYLNHRTCCLCLRILGNKSKLVTHHRTHTKELPYSCSVCDKSFAENSTLRKHEATHGAKNFECQICGKGFVRKDYLSKHLLIHKQTFKCSECAFVCDKREDIESHVGLHHEVVM